jgi:adenylate cyclase
VKIGKAAWRRAGIGLGLVVAVNVLVLGLLFRDGLHDQQIVFNDLLMRQAAGRLNLGSIVIAAIDDASLRAYGRLPEWDRKHYADLIRQLKKAGARAVAFDVAFLDSAPGDADLAAAIDQAMYPKDGSQTMPVILAVVGDGLPNHVAGKGLEFEGFQPLVPDIARAKPILAAVNVDLDGISVRNLPLLYYSGQQQYLPLPLVGASAFAARLPGFTNALQFMDEPFRLQFGPYAIPIDSYFRMPIYFFSKPYGYQPNAISLARIADGQANPEALRNRLVFVGAYQATGLADDYPVPTNVNGKMPGVEIWANAAQSLIEGKFITPQPWSTTFGFMLGLSLVAGVVFLRFGALGWLATILIGASYTVVRYLFAAGQLVEPAAIGHQQTVEMPNFAYVDVALFTSSALLFLCLFLQEQRRRRAVYSTFGRYVTPAVAQQLSTMQASGELNLGGSRRVATIMFGNVYLPRGVKAEDTLRLLNAYFEGIVHIVNQHNGTVNKFIGDHIMVMFNVPVDLEDHAAAACRAAHKAVEWVKEHRKSLPGEEATFGVGLNTGQLVAGNMGSKNRMEYTVLGDTVNTASRLSGVAKDDEVIISQATVDLLDGSGAKLEDRGEVRVKGKAEPVRVYAVLGFADSGPVQIMQPAGAPAGVIPTSGS